MSAGRVSVLMHHMHRLLGARLDPQSDVPLLERFVRQRDEQAFAVIVSRYGPLVWSVSRRVTENEQDAEDVFQATFLVLARKAATIRKSASVGSWLFGVAHRLALRTRTDASRRRRHEERAVRPAVPDQSHDVILRELRTVLDEELARLSDKYRAPLLLCYLEELTQEEAAARLGWSKRLVKYRLERGRHQLRTGLARRGLTLSVALTGSMLAASASSAAVPAALADATLRLAIPFALGQPAAGAISARALALAEGGLKTMIHSKLWTVAVGMLALAAAAGGAGLLLGHAAPDDGQKPLAPAAEKEHVDLVGDPLPRGAVARLGTTRFRTGIHGWRLTGLGFTPNGKTIVSAAGGNAVQLWDAATGKLLREISTDIAHVRGFALSPDGKYVAVGGFLEDAENAPVRGAVGIWEVSSGKEVRTWKRDSADVDNCCLAFTPDSKLLVSSGGRSAVLRVEDVVSGVEILRHQFPRDIGGSLALSPDGSTLAVASGPNTHKLYVWQWKEGEEPRELNAPRYAGKSLAFSPDNKRLAECGDTDDIVRVWDVAGGRLVHKLIATEAESYSNGSLAYAPDGKTIIASGRSRTGGTVHLWDAATGRCRTRLDANVGILAVSPDSGLLAGASDGGLRVWNLASGKELAANDEAHQATIHQIAVTGNQVVTTGDDHTIRIWDGTSGKQKRKLTHDYWVRAVAVSPDGTQVASSGLDDFDCLWDLATGRRIYKLPGHGKLGGHRAVSFTPDGKHFLSWGDDFYLRKWDVATGKVVQEQRLQPTGVKVPAEDAEEVGGRMQLEFMMLCEGTFAPDSKTFVLSLGKEFHVFDVATGKDLRQIANEGGHVIALAISPDGKLLLASAWGKPVAIKLPDGSTRHSAAKNHSVYLWELSSGKFLDQVNFPEGGAGPVAFSPDAKQFAVATDKPDGRVHLFAVAQVQELGVIRGFRGAVRSLTFAADGNRLISGMDDTTALVWDLPKPDVPKKH